MKMITTLKVINHPRIQTSHPSNSKHPLIRQSMRQRCAVVWPTGHRPKGRAYSELRNVVPGRSYFFMNYEVENFELEISVLTNC